MSAGALEAWERLRRLLLSNGEKRKRVLEDCGTVARALSGHTPLEAVCDNCGRPVTIERVTCATCTGTREELEVRDAE